MLREVASRIRAGTRRQNHVVGASIGRAQLSFGAVWASESAFMVGIAVVAFRDGGVTAQTFARGCLTVLTVVVVIDLLGLGDSAVGVLIAAVGAGGMVGSLLAFGVVGRGGLALRFGRGVALFGAPLGVVGVFPQ